MLGRLLLADPEPGRSDLLVKHLQAAGYQVRLLEESMELVTTVEQEKPDALILQAVSDHQVVLLLINVPLTILALLMGPALAWVAVRSSRRSHAVLVDVQQKVADVTQTAEESIATLLPLLNLCPSG